MQSRLPTRSCSQTGLSKDLRMEIFGQPCSASCAHCSAIVMRRLDQDGPPPIFRPGRSRWRSPCLPHSRPPAARWRCRSPCRASAHPDFSWMAGSRSFSTASGSPPWAWISLSGTCSSGLGSGGQSSVTSPPARGSSSSTRSVRSAPAAPRMPIASRASSGAASTKTRMRPSCTSFS